MNTRIDDLPDLLTDGDMAAFLGKSVGTVQKMRLQGGLPFLPGRPALVLKKDFLEHLEKNRIIREAKNPPPPKPYAEMTPGEQAESARVRALKMKHKPIRRRRPAP